MNYYLLFDNKHDNHQFITDRINLSKPLNVIYSPNCKRKIFGWLKGVLIVLSKSERNDTIICWYDFQAVLCFWICRLMFMRRKIICINILLKNKPTAKNKVVSCLYKKALLADNFKASVTSVKYGEWLNSKLGINANYTLIHDVYHETYKYPHKVEIEPGSVFCGGHNGRDWDFILKVAKAMPDVKFNIVMPFYVYQRYCSQFTDNINVRYDIPYEEFMKIMCSSQLVCLPLDTEAPAGLIVMFQAAANLKPIITTETVTTLEYITPERGVTIPNEISIWCSAIKNCFENMEESKKKAVNMMNYLSENCSENKFVCGIKMFI